MNIIPIILVLSIPFTIILSAIAVANLMEFLKRREKTKAFSFSVKYHKDDESWIGECDQFKYLTGYGSTPEKAITEIKKVVRFGNEILKDREKENDGC